VTTADRIDPVGYRSWAAPVVIVDDDAKDYVGQHRQPGRRSFSLHRMFYSAQHRARGR
jgi:hypothetical protein